MTVEEWLPGKIWKCNKEKENINVDENSKYAINIDNERNKLAFTVKKKVNLLVPKGSNWTAEREKQQNGGVKITDTDLKAASASIIKILG